MILHMNHQPETRDPLGALMGAGVTLKKDLSAGLEADHLKTRAPSSQSRTKFTSRVLSLNRAPLTLMVQQCHRELIQMA
ncbi:hypothetical protein AOLI_G00091920 [Acnodon oligacanthus]